MPKPALSSKGDPKRKLRAIMPTNPPHKAAGRATKAIYAKAGISARPDYPALLAALRAAKASFTPEAYQAILADLKDRQAFREASRRRQKAYRKRKKVAE